MIPIGDDVGQVRTGLPVVNISLIVINVIAFLIQLAVGPDQSVMAYGTIPYEITHGVDLAGNQGGLAQQAISLPVYVTLLTSMFMHGGLLHIAGNMLFLFIFGDNVEDVMGSARYLIFYLLCGFAATFAQILADTNSVIPGVGASGAIAGVMAAYLVLFPQARIRVLIGYLGVGQVPAIAMIGFWFVLQLFNGVGSIATSQQGGGGVAYWAHVGGFAAGFILVFIFRRNSTGGLALPGFGNR